MAQNTVLKVEGPPGSGKSRELAREACRLVAQDGIPADQVLLLAISEKNRKVLEKFLKEEASQSGLQTVSFRIQTLDSFLLEHLQALSSTKIQLLDEETALILLYSQLHQNTRLPEPLTKTTPLSRSLLKLFQTLDLKQVEPAQFSDILGFVPGQAQWIGPLYRQWVQNLQSFNLVSQCQTVHRLLKAGQADAIGQQYRVILADEVQEWPKAHHQFFASLPVDLVLAGHAGLSIRSSWGAAPEAFESLKAYQNHRVTFLNKTAGMRGFEPALSLANPLLPNTIWEEQALDRERLQTEAQFAYAREPRQEADLLAKHMTGWVNNAQVEERGANWNDCTILLRSSHYEAFITDAFLEHQIPFRSEIVSESVIDMQHGLYDLLAILDALQALEYASPFSRVAEQIEQANRHTRRWLERMRSEDSTTIDWASFNPDKTLIFELPRNEKVPAPIVALIQQLLDWHKIYGNEKSLASLILKLETEWLSQLDNSDPNMQTYWNAFKEKLETWEARHSRMSASFSLSEMLTHYPLLWKLTNEQKPKSLPGPQVRLTSIHGMQSDETPFIAIPFMVADEFPQTRHTVELLDESAAENSGLNFQTDTAEEARLLAVGMSRASRRLWISSHQTDVGDREAPVLPSPFYVTLLNAKRKLLGQPVSLEVCSCDNNQCTLDICGFAPQNAEEADSISGRYTGESLWANYLADEEESLFETDDILTLSASAMHTYMSCPRQFYYRHLLKIKQPENQAAQLGTLIHRVMEIFNRNAGKQPYTAATLKNLASCLFRFSEAPDIFANAGYLPRDGKALSDLNPLALEDLRQRLFASIEDLENKGYFDMYADAQAIHAEKALAHFRIEGINRCAFTGKLDAVIQRNDGTWDILDYKTYRSAYGTRIETCNKHFAATLAPLSDVPDLSAAERFGDRLNSSYPKDYQLPLYYLACQQQPEYQGKLRSAALQMIRPEFSDNPVQGAIRLELLAEEIDAAKAQLVSDINRYIVEPIASASRFAATPSQGCDYCPYTGICDIDGTDAEADE